MEAGSKGQFPVSRAFSTVTVPAFCAWYFLSRAHPTGSGGGLLSTAV